MKTPRSSSDSSWDDLVRQARADRPPAIDSAALLRSVRAEPLALPPNWSAEFAGLFNLHRLLPVCALGTCVFALLATWQIWDLVDTLPWAQLMTATIGGGS